MKHTTLRAIVPATLSLIAILLGTLGAAAQQYKLRIRNTDVTLEPNAKKWFDSVQNVEHQPALVYLHFKALPTNAQKKQLENNGIKLLDYLPDNTYTALVTKVKANLDVTTSGINNVLPVATEWKADKYVWKLAASTEGKMSVMVSFYSWISAGQIKDFLASVGAEIQTGPAEQFNMYRVTIAAGNLRNLAQWHGICNISPATDMVPFDLQSRPAVKGNLAVLPASVGGEGLNGDSVTVGVGDNASGIYHADLYDRIHNFNPGGKANHGAHVNGIVGGAGNLDPQAEGMATHAGLVDFQYDMVLGGTGAMYRDYNMNITNNSYGVILGDCDYSGTYDGYARFLDSLTLKYPKVLHVFASGNDGWMNCSPYPLGFNTVGGGYQPAKNNVVVGSMTDFLGQAYDESRGPTTDGRIKPEIVAIGLGAYSTIGEDLYEWAAGTSMAAPQVAGGLALITQRFKQLNGDTLPDAGLLKAILLNGAQDLGIQGPDYSYGFGGLDVYRTLQIANNKWYKNDSISNGDSIMIPISVPSGTAQLKVLLNWMDQPANPASSRQLVNDLDLAVALGSNVHYPLVPDPDPARVTAKATEKADHLNTVEQVIINRPAAGTYNLKVKAGLVPVGPQKFSIAWDLVPAGLKITYPSGGEQWMNKDTLRFFWQADTTGPFNLEFSDNNGSTWNPIIFNLAPEIRHYSWKPNGISSGNCLFRLSRTASGESQTSGKFAINDAPFVQADTAQCPGYINIHWSPVARATKYLLLAKVGAYMGIVDSTTDTTYSYRGMPLNKRSYVAVQPIIDGMRGYRSNAVSYVADHGNCTSNLSRGDLALEKVLSPLNGRELTQSQHTTHDTLKLAIRNLGNINCTSFTINFRINGGSWQSVPGSGILPALGATVINIPGLDLTASGSYTIDVTITNLSAADAVTSNNAATIVVSTLPNPAIALPFIEDFEALPAFSVNHAAIGLPAAPRWDFYNTDTTGRIRSFVNSDITITGNRSASMDADKAVSDGSANLLTGTFNLQAYDTGTSEIRLDFDYMLHGTPKTTAGNTVYYRTNDGLGWSPLYNYDLSVYPGTLNRAKSASLTDAAILQHQNFSTSTQISFGQKDTSLIAAPNYGNGLTIDNIRLYTVTNDAQLTGIVAPLITNCGLTGSQPVIVKIRNGVKNKLYNIALYYQADGGALHTGIIDSLDGKTETNFTFPDQLTIAEGVPHAMNVWLQVTGDSYALNDSVLNYRYRNNRVVASYPYLENFENGNGGYYADGINSSWQYGTPASPYINRAASGIKAWKTNLTGRYNNLEQSYLYSPCFDISTLSKPALSFSAALDIENCGNTMCDQALVEYSFNGINWYKLGNTGQGTNWYDSTFNVWNTAHKARWHVTSSALPLPTGSSVISLRFALKSDPGATLEGFSVDDIHIYNDTSKIAPADNLNTETRLAGGSSWVRYNNSNGELAAIDTRGQNLGNTNVSLYPQSILHNPGQTQYIMPRSYLVVPENGNTDSVRVRLFLTDSEVVRVLTDTSCPSCNPIKDAYQLGITQFNDPLHETCENGNIADDTAGYLRFIPSRKINWIPYRNGYMAEATTSQLKELWLNNGGPTGVFPAGIDYLNFAAWRNGDDVTTTWHSLIDTVVYMYHLERSWNGADFTALLDTQATHLADANYLKNDNGVLTDSSVVYYRLKYALTRDTTTQLFSPVRKVSKDDGIERLVDFTVTPYAAGLAIAAWTSYIDGVVNKYILESSVRNKPYSLLYVVDAKKHYGQNYSVTDQSPTAINGDQVTYRLRAIMNSGDTLTLPLRSIQWILANALADVYPNPSANGELNIIWYAMPQTELKLRLTDLQGRTIATYSGTSVLWKNVLPLQAPAGLKGMYLLHAQIGSDQMVKKIVFE